MADFCSLLKLSSFVPECGETHAGTSAVHDETGKTRLCSHEVSTCSLEFAQTDITSWWSDEPVLRNHNVLSGAFKQVYVNRVARFLTTVFYYLLEHVLSC